MKKTLYPSTTTAFEMAVRDGRYEEEGWRVRKDGSRFWANVLITAVRNERDELVGFTKVTRDMTERRAMAAERDSVDRYVAAYMQDRVGAVFDGRITGVTRFGLFLRLAETGADGLMPMRALGMEFFRHDEKRHALVGERTKMTYSLGETIRVRLAEAAPLTGGLRFDLAVDDETAPVPKRREPVRPRSRRRG